MCVTMQEHQTLVRASKKSTSYNIKRVLKTIFKKQQKRKNSDHKSQELFESAKYFHNSQTEIYHTEINDNSANEKLTHIIMEGLEYRDHHRDTDIYVPVRYARTEVGTFFWTTNLQPVMSIVTDADKDLVQPAYCYSNSQWPQLQFGDRWAQA